MLGAVNDAEVGDPRAGLVVDEHARLVPSDGLGANERCVESRVGLQRRVVATERRRLLAEHDAPIVILDRDVQIPNLEHVTVEVSGIRRSARIMERLRSNGWLKKSTPVALTVHSSAC